MKIKSKFSSIDRKDILLKSQQCLDTNAGRVGLEYLLKKRHLSEGAIRKFELGYVPSSVAHQLSGRIIFPIYDTSNNLICLSSRLIEGESALPVHWHESYEKSFFLYGCNHAKEFMMKYGFVVLVEGQMDVIRLHDNGITNVVALGGLKLHDIQRALIYRYCDEILVLLDSDANRTGQRATQILCDQKKYACAGGKRFYTDDYSSKIFALQFSENLDPDDFITKYGAGNLKRMIKNRIQEIRQRGY